MTVLAEIATYLDAQVASLTAATNLFAGQMPDAPDTAVCLHHRPGAPVYHLGAEDGVPQVPVYENHRLQIEVRAANAATAYTDAESLANEICGLLTLINVTLSGARYLLIEPTTLPAPTEEDKQGRITFVINFQIQREPHA